MQMVWSSNLLVAAIFCNFFVTTSTIRFLNHGTIKVIEQLVFIAPCLCFDMEWWVFFDKSFLRENTSFTCNWFK